MWNEEPYVRLDRPVERVERLSDHQYGFWDMPASQGASASQSMWSRDPPTPPRARPLPANDFPQPRHSWGQALQAERSRTREARKDHEVRQRQTTSFDTYAVKDQFKASSSLPAAEVRPPWEPGNVRCEKCDEAHETEMCPYFKQPREKHTDAWQNYSGVTRSPDRPSKQMRECIAPRGLSYHAVRVIRMPGDGSCLFHSIAFGLNALGYHQEAGHTVRQRVANFISDRPDFEITGTPLRSWIEWDSQMTVSSYANRLLSGSCWGGAIEMAACSQIFAIDVAVYEEDRRGGFSRISDFITDKKPYGAVLVLYSGRSHYDALQMSSPQDVSVVSRRGGYGAEHGAYYAGPEAAEDDEWMCSLM